LGVGTHLKYYINEGGAYNDITPIRLTTSAGDVTFDASANTLSAGISIIEDIIPLTSSTGFPDSGRIKIDSEIITYASVSGNNLIGCSRGQNARQPRRIVRRRRLPVQRFSLHAWATVRWTTTLLRFLALQRWAMRLLRIS
jgi:hypothetical protein